MCHLMDIDYFYVMAGLPTSHVIAQVTAVTGVPVFVYDTTRDSHSFSQVSKKLEEH